MFIGREKELSTLEKLYSSDSFEFAVIYGRRRVGKTTLISNFCKDKESIFFVAEEFDNEFNLRKFTEVVLEKYKENYIDKFTDWLKAFKYIASKAKNERLILVIDEFPYIAKANRTLMSILQNIIDHEFLETKIMLILCGSAMSFMENKVLGYKSPLFGRRTAQMQIKPFNFYEASRFLENYSINDRIITYSILGGVPQYLLKFDYKKSVKENIISNILDTSAYLYEEPINLLKQEMRQPALYNSIISAIAGGYSKLNEIATKISATTDKTATYLKNLQELRIITRVTPIMEKDNSRKSIYKFYYKFVVNNVNLIEQGNTKYVYDKIKDELNGYVSYIYEDICIDYLIELNKKQENPFMIEQIGKWWGGNPKTKKQEEIDIVGIGNESMIFGECKYRNEKVDIEVVEDLIRKSEIFGCDDKYYYVFSRSGFTKRVEDYARENERVRLIWDQEI